MQKSNSTLMESATWAINELVDLISVHYRGDAQTFKMLHALEHRQVIRHMRCMQLRAYLTQGVAEIARQKGIEVLPKETKVSLIKKIILLEFPPISNGTSHHQ